MPHVGEVYYRNDASLDERTSASDTLTGATSADVHYGHGQPVQGETSAQIYHDGQAHRKRQGGGVEQHGVQSGALDNVNHNNEMQDIKRQGTERHIVLYSPKSVQVYDSGNQALLMLSTQHRNENAGDHTHVQHIIIVGA